MRRKIDTDITDAPQPYGDIIDAVCDRDRAWFEQHPGETEYTRPLVDGEMWPWVPPPAAACAHDRLPRVTISDPGQAWSGLSDSRPPWRDTRYGAGFY